MSFNTTISQTYTQIAIKKQTPKQYDVNLFTQKFCSRFFFKWAIQV